jgi:uncharacterized cupin superfamily protein
VVASVYNLVSEQLRNELERDGWRTRSTRVASEIGASSIGGSVYDVPEGEQTFPYHYHHGAEEWLIVLTGTPTLRTPDGTRTLKPGDVVCFPSGAEGAHVVGGPGRILLLSNADSTTVAVYPDSDKLGTRPRDDDRDRLDFRRADSVGYWDGER